MATVTFKGEIFTCVTALKGEDYVHLLDSNGCMVAAFDEVTDFSAFTVTDGDWTNPTEAHDCHITVMGDDGVIRMGGHKCSDLNRAEKVTVPADTATALGLTDATVDEALGKLKDTAYVETKQVQIGIKGRDWQNGSIPSNFNGYRVAYGNGRFVVLTTGGYSSGSYSDDGINWQTMSLPISSSIGGVCYGAGKFLAVASGSSQVVAESSDGINWTYTGTVLPMNHNWQSVCYGADKFVAVGMSSTSASQDGAYSFDGVTWTKVSLAYTAKWSSVCYGNGKFVAVSTSGGCNYSTNGISWNTLTMPISGHNSVCYGGDKFVAVGSSGVVYSTDGITWALATMPVTATWQSVCYGDGMFVAVGNGVCAYSTDGINWTTNVVSGRNILSVCYGEGNFVGVTSTEALYSVDIYDYQKTIVDIMGSELLRLPGVKIETGSYRGTGTAGKNYPVNITFSFEPKLVIVYGGVGGLRSGGTYWANSFIWTKGQTSATTYSGASIVLTQTNTALSWYTTNTGSSKAEIQLNVSGDTYNYLAIG